MFAIRVMREEDLAAVAALEAQIFSDAWSENAIRESLKQKQSFLLAAFEDKRLVGYLIFYCVLEEGEIARIAVDPEYHRKGVGSKLMLELENWCEDKGISKILLELRESNQEAYSFYETMGFEQDGIRQKFYSNPTEDAILMSRELGA